jgi:hypothetical protein
MKSANFLLVLLSLVSINMYGQNPPSDFKFIGTAGGAAPWSVSNTITILANGQVHFFSSKGGSSPQILADTNFTISASSVQQIWQTIQNENFFSLNSDYKNDTVKGGSVVIFTITANGTTKQVRVKNTSQQQIQDIISGVNSNLPSYYNLPYEPPVKVNIIPQDPCGTILKASAFRNKKNFSKSYLTKMQLSVKSFNSVQDAVQIPHAGVEIGYEESLYDAVGNGNASLSGKGGFFGDQVSITGNYNNFNPPDPNTINIKLNLEFYGPCDNDANEFKIVKDIYNKWNGVTTSSGKTIKMDIGTISHPGATSPPGTPGFDDINLACGNGTSSCDGLGSPNNGVMGGTWYPSDNDAGTFGHEAGHLMGLDDQYSSFAKQPDGSWLNEQDNTTKYSASDFLNLYHSKHPSDNLSDDQNFLNGTQRAGWPSAGHENDLMGDQSKPPLQSDIDKLAAQAGLIIDINPGDILVNTGDYQQNFVVTHSGNLFLNPGESKTLNGIYAACIDHFKGVPDSSVIFDVAPPLNDWNGISAAPYLFKLVKLIDSLGYYCNLIDYPFAQLAIWRITDNSDYHNNIFVDNPTALATDNLLRTAGIDPGSQFFDFPRMNFSDTTSRSKKYIPDELFAVNIEPTYQEGRINEKSSFTGTVSGPSGVSFTSSFTWYSGFSFFNNSIKISPNGSSVDLTPLERGIFPLNIDLTIKDSAGSEKEILPGTTSYLIVPDRYTETFEHNNLADKMPWQTSVSFPWRISSTESETGSNSVQPSSVSQGQSSELEIECDFPTDSVLVFSVKSETNSGYLEFYVDSVSQGIWTGLKDWQFSYSYLNAGHHILHWIYNEFYDASQDSANIWVDNIFFPENSVVVSVKSNEGLPNKFGLFQNYPNPFNPATEIKYSLAEQSYVKIKLFDILGRQVKELFTGLQNSGVHFINFNGSNLSSGVYLYSIEADYGKGIYKNVKKMILLK